MNTSTFRQILARRFHWTIPLLFTAALVALMAGIPVHDASAHAELVRAEPPIDGLVVAPPDQLQLFFSEDVATANPAPAVQLLDENGKSQKVSIESQGADAREVVVEIPNLGNGTWTVSWTVKSTDDGHVLSGTYAFRIGEGLPPGLATVEGQQPEAWAVATRWLTFLGAAIAGAGFLFSIVVFGKELEPVRSSRKRTRLILAGAVLALIATIIEPFMQVLFPVEGVDLSVGSAIRGLPSAWWYRPAALIPLVILAVVAAYPLRGRISFPVGIIGGALALISLLGLSLTSHAAARDSFRSVASATDTLHQWSTALWVGGLFSLLLWWVNHPVAESSSTPGAIASPDFPLKRFSALALWLFIVAVLTGLLNAWLVLPHKETSFLGLGDASLPVISKLWSSDYGIVLLIKVLILLLPFSLAAFHHRAITRATRTGVQISAGVLSKTLRMESIVVCAVVLGGSILALSAPTPISQHALQNVALASLATPAQGDPTEIVHLTIDPAKQGKNSLSLRLTDLSGKVPAVTTPARLAMTFTSLSHGTVRSDVSVQPSNLATSTYTAAGLDLSIDGWWKIEV
ncbi:MAG: copper resistance CopC/CopD family protein, partial [Thermomicrobiales bacterium]